MPLGGELHPIRSVYHLRSPVFWRQLVEQLNQGLRLAAFQGVLGLESGPADAIAEPRKARKCCYLGLWPSLGAG